MPRRTHLQSIDELRVQVLELSVDIQPTIAGEKVPIHSSETESSHYQI